MRTPNGKYPQYHTSADDLKLVTSSALAESLHQLLSVVQVLEANRSFVNLNPKCEPQLGRRGLYRAMGGTSSQGLEEAILWILNLSDGSRSLLDISQKSGMDFRRLHSASELLLDHGLLAGHEHRTNDSRSGRALIFLGVSKWWLTRSLLKGDCERQGRRQTRIYICGNRNQQRFSIRIADSAFL